MVKTKKYLSKLILLLLGVTIISTCTLIAGYEMLSVTNILFGIPLLFRYIGSTTDLISYPWRKMCMSMLWIILHGVQPASVITLQIENFYGMAIPMLSESFVVQEQTILSDILSKYILTFFSIFPPISILIMCLIAFWIPSLNVVIIDISIAFATKIVCWFLRKESA